jgi:hypothetical protein
MSQGVGILLFDKSIFSKNSSLKVFSLFSHQFLAEPPKLHNLIHKTF